MSGEYNKALVGVVMAILILLEDWFGWSFGITEEVVITILAVLTPVFIWLVPNRPA